MNDLFEKEPICFESPEKNVWKYIFHFKGAIAEAVLYRYNSFVERTVLCVSVQSGCPVGCTFCGTGAKFIRNLSTDEIVSQVVHIMDDKKIIASDVNKFQIMFMSMGEPFLNYKELQPAIMRLDCYYSNAQLLVSTVAPRNEADLHKFKTLCKDYDNVGLQFSIHMSTDHERDKLIPYKNKLSLVEIRDYGVQWWHETNRKVYLNYCVNDWNSMKMDFNNLRTLFPPNVFCFTFSVICSKDETMKDAGYRNLEQIKKFETLFIEAGYDTRIFDPAGQDSIGGGCGQLFYVQEWLKNRLTN